MGITADELLAGPRGRLLCFELAQAWEESAARDLTSSQLAAAAAAGETGPDAWGRYEELHPLAIAAYTADTALDPNPRGVAYGASLPGFPHPSEAQLDEARREQAALDAPLRSNPHPAIAAVVAALENIPVSEPSGPDLIEALGNTVGAARGWQAPSGTDVLLARAELAPGLRRIAEAVARSPHTAWWSRRPDLAQQWLLNHEAATDTARWTTPGDAPRALEKMIEDRARPLDPGVSGEWWTAPITWSGAHGMRLPTSYGLIPESAGTAAAGGPAESTLDPLYAPGTPTGFMILEDSGPQDRRMQAARLQPPVPARVLSVASPAQWAALCSRFPLEISAAYRWQAREALYTDGSDPSSREETWVLPDWRAVAREYDAVHLTVAAYLAGATRPIEVPGLGATAITGWDPDATFWLASPPQQPEPTEANGLLRAWVKDEDAEGDGTGDYREVTRAG